MRLQGKSAARFRKGRKTRLPLDLEMMESRQLLSVYTVANNGDSGTGSFRQAILDSNGNPGTNTIKFALPNDELTIAPLTPLPTVTNTGTTIDGTTQPNYNKTTGQPVVTLDGSSLPSTSGGPGLAFNGGADVVKGLVISSFGGLNPGIQLTGSPGDLVQDCYLGTSANGLAAAGNGGDGIDVGTSNCTIGGAGITQRNVISGNVFQGINVTAGRVTIQGNYIGVGADGATVVANGFTGIQLNGTVNNLVGGIASGVGNVISGNGFDGIFIFASALTSDVIQGNFIGTDATGTIAVGNTFDGIDDDGGANNTIGGTGAAGNVISGNADNGIAFSFTTAKNNIVAGNKIGVGSDGTTPWATSWPASWSTARTIRSSAARASPRGT